MDKTRKIREPEIIPESNSFIKSVKKVLLIQIVVCIIFILTTLLYYSHTL